MASPSQRAALRRLAITRLATVLLLAAGLWSISCRPTWSPDGSVIRYPARTGAGTAIVEYSVKDKTARIVHRLGGVDGAAVTVLDSATGDWIVLEADATEDNVLNVSRLDKTGKEATRHVVDVGARAVTLLLGEPIVIGGKVILSGPSPQTIDLGTGKLEEPVAKQPGRKPMVIVRRGDGLAFADVVAPGFERAGSNMNRNRLWRIGTLDATTMEPTVLVECPSDCTWEIMPYPAFAPKLDRIAVAAYRETEDSKSRRLLRPDEGELDVAANREAENGKSQDREWAILVLREGAIESTIILDRKVAAGTANWSPDGGSILATLVRFTGKGYALSLFETDLSGSVTRETKLFAVDESKEADPDSVLLMPLAMQPVLSPDGRWVALTTACISEAPAEQAGLLLIDRKDAKREVTRVPFPSAAKPERDK
jgi:hypothetical protein